MCDTNVVGTIVNHRKNPHHQSLKEFLHPKCKVCNKDFTVRTDWDEHRISVGHLKKMAEKGMKEHDKEKYLEFLGPELNVKNSNQNNGQEKANQGPTKAQLEETKKLDESKIMEYEIPDFDQNKGIGISFIKPVNGKFCRLCKKFLAVDLVTEHIRSKAHYEKFAESVKTKKAEKVS